VSWCIRGHAVLQSHRGFGNRHHACSSCVSLWCCPRVQLLGLTNYSHWNHANELRSCLTDSKQLQSDIHDFALQRLKRFSHVGTTDRLYPSVESMAATLGRPLDGPAYGPGEVRGVCLCENTCSVRYFLFCSQEPGRQPDRRSHESAAAFLAMMKSSSIRQRLVYG